MDKSYQNEDETINIFREECEEILRDFVSKLNEYEKNEDVEIITKLMRDAHSIKGSAGIVGLEDVQKLAHKTEDLLSEIKNEKQNGYTPDLSRKNERLSAIKDFVFQISTLIKNAFVLQNGCSVEDLFNEMLKMVSFFKSDVAKNASAAKDITEKLLEKNFNSEIQDILKSLLYIFSKLEKCQEIRNTNLINTLSGAIKGIKRNVCENDTACSEDILFLDQRLSVASEMIDYQVFPAEKENLLIEKKSFDTSKEKNKKDISDILKILGQESIKTLRIETSKLDNLYDNIRQIGLIMQSSKANFYLENELTASLSRKIFDFERISGKIKQIVEKVEKDNDFNSFMADLKQKTYDIENNINDIQILMSEFEKVNESEKDIIPKFQEHFEMVEKTVKNIRILPIGIILHMFPRMVRDIAQRENKLVNIDVTGSETYVDKKILEEIKTPLIHLLRNAVDHGIEPPEEREKLGKTPAGNIKISVKSKDENIIISVSDDGCGINFDKIKQKALKDKLFGQKELEKFKKHDFLKMIFKAGFTTEDKVTEISGRGMGLDIVYTKITELNGDIKINTEKSKGTEVLMKIPSGYLVKKQDGKIKKQKAKIILADDSKTTQMYLSKILENNGFCVKCCSDGKECLKEIKNDEYNLLISDVEMPSVNGAELVMKIRKHKALKNIPVIIISMLAEDKVTQLFRNIPVDLIINKNNFNEREFVNSVNKVLSLEE